MRATILQKFILPIAFAIVSTMLTDNCYAQSNVRLEGELEIMIEDYSNGNSRTRNYLVKKDKKRVEIKGKISPKLKTGDKIRIRGNLKKVNATTEEINLDTSDGGIEVLALAPLPSTTGEQRVAVILLNFTDDTTQPISQADAHTNVFTNVNNYYKEASGQKTSLAGDVFGYFTIPYSDTVCDSYAWAAAADSAVTASGVNLNNYPRKIYMFPRTSCGWSGLGNVGGTDTRSWVNGSFGLLVVGHELGHNFGLHHAHALNCDVSTLGNTCTTLMYGDAADMMGNMKAAHFSAHAKERLGWLDSTSQILTASSTNRYIIEPYSSSSAGAKAIRISRGGGLWYYLEYRQPIGHDSILTLGNITKGITVRSVIEGDLNSLNQLDMTPGSSTNTNVEMYDGALGVGLSYSDSAAKISFTLVSADASSAVVDVSIGTVTTPTEPVPPPPSGDTTVPVVSISNPIAGSAFAARTTISISGIATDNIAVTKVEVYVNNSLICTSPSSTYACGWKVPSGKSKTFSIEARAYDAAGNIGRKQISISSR